MNNLEGILVINKPKGITSRDVVNILNKELNTKKIGHTGTLDPIASGVLVVLIGKSTKLCNYLTSYDKEYEASFKLGIQTDTLDTDGKILKEEKINIDDTKVITAIHQMKKTYDQEVPIYSSVKINGKKLYDYARSGESVTLPKRKVTIYDIDYIKKENDEYFFKTKVSKGTYIRSLIRDIGLSLNTNAVMTSLVRTKQGEYSIDNAYTIEDIKSGNFKIISPKDIFTSISIDEDTYKKVSNGVKIKLDTNEDIVSLIYNEKLIALYKKDDNFYKMFIKFA